MRVCLISLTVLWALCLSAVAQDSLLFTVNDSTAPVETGSGSGGTSLQFLTPEDIAVVQPVGNPYSAETLLNQMNFNTLLGDRDCDGVYFQDPLTDHIDALLLCDPFLDVDIRQLYFSTSVGVGCVGCGGEIRPGDVVSIRTNGVLSFFLTQEQVRSAFLIPAAYPVNVDAVTKDASGNIYLSLEDNVEIWGGALAVGDGAILGIPSFAIQYNGCEVGNLISGSGFPVLSESEVDLLVTNSLVSGTSGNPVGTIGDLDGLEVDRTDLGGFWIETPSGPFLVPHLLFCGERLEGGSVLSTLGGGTIALLNAQRLGRQAPNPTLGERVGLRPLVTTPSLNALAITSTPQVSRLALDSTTPDLSGGAGTIEITLGGALPGAPVLVGVVLGNLAGCSADSSVVIPNNGFDYYFLPTLFLPPFSAGPDGFSQTTAAYPGGVPAGLHFVFQGITLMGGVAFTAPISIVF